MKKNEMIQKSGKDSKNYQIQEINIGLSYKDAKDLCCDLINSELELYKQEAQKEAKIREEKLRTDFLNEIEKNKINLQELKSPAMQLCYIEAQKAFISHGNNDSEEMLLELLKTRMSESENSILQISLEEAIKISQMLQKKHLDLLSLLFFIKEATLMGVITREEIITKITNIIKTFTKNNIFSKIDYEYLEYNKCIIKKNLLKSDIFKIIKEKYKYYFLNEISYDEFKIKYKNLEKYIGVLSFFTIDNDNIMRFKEIDSFLSHNNLEIIYPEDIDTFKKLIKNQIMSDKEFENVLLNNNELLQSFFYTWEDEEISSSNLTIIGKVLAISNIKINLNEKIDLNDWIY